MNFGFAETTTIFSFFSTATVTMVLMLGVTVVYLGLVTTFLSAISLLKPLVFLGISTRGRACITLVIGLALVVVGAVVPARETRVSSPRTQLDQFVPVYQFNEVHTMRVQTSCERA